MALQHPFLVRLYTTFQDKNCVYMLLEVSLGGELFSVLRSRTLFDETTSRFYGAGVVVAFQFMHERGYIYRSVNEGSEWRRDSDSQSSSGVTLLTELVMCVVV